MLSGFIVNGVPHPNVVVNKSYEYDKINKYTNNIRDENRKCRVEIAPNELNDLNVKTKTTQPTLLLIAENRGYEIVTITESNGNTLTNGISVPSDGSIESVQTRRVSQRGKKQLSSADLLNFAKQIATGMVIKKYNRNTQTYFFLLNNSPLVCI